MAHFLCLWCFNKQEGVEASMKEFFTLKEVLACNQRTGKKVISDSAS